MTFALLQPWNKSTISPRYAYIQLYMGEGDYHSFSSVHSIHPDRLSILANQAVGGIGHTLPEVSTGSSSHPFVDALQWAAERSWVENMVPALLGAGSFMSPILQPTWQRHSRSQKGKLRGSAPIANFSKAEDYLWCFLSLIIKDRRLVWKDHFLSNNLQLLFL